MKAVNDFIQKNRQKSEAEKRNILLSVMIVVGLVVISVGMIDISNNLVSIYQDGNSSGNKKSSIAAIQDKFSEVWGEAENRMQYINDSMGQEYDGQEK
ncbi:MAG: hypothetical protein HZA94_00685 [Candidatus Vogelbacteria bacterium]|nr:hypothetical protein [Candidatus Vogelbacteria bacterium]